VLGRDRDGLEHRRQGIGTDLLRAAAMRLIDVIHRLHSAIMRGQDDIDVQSYDSDDEAAFILAARAKIARRLPLSPADRSAAAVRIARSHPEWSDRDHRRFVSQDGCAICRRLTEQIARLNRIGGDGRTRPVDSSS
jgi:hypothetical protein